jgi:hypothetical protein
MTPDNMDKENKNGKNSGLIDGKIDSSGIKTSSDVLTRNSKIKKSIRSFLLLDVGELLEERIPNTSIYRYISGFFHRISQRLRRNRIEGKKRIKHIVKRNALIALLICVLGFFAILTCILLSNNSGAADVHNPVFLGSIILIAIWLGSTILIILITIGITRLWYDY